MTYLLTVCALALTLASSADQAQARSGGSFRGATAGVTKPASAPYVRDHRVPYVGPGGGVRVYKTCKGVGFACREPHNH
jgi:hypothetical protein